MLTSRFGSAGFVWPSVTVTRFAVFDCAAKLRFDAVGRPVPVGYAVSRLGDVPLTAVTLSTTALAPVELVVLIGSVPDGRPMTLEICTASVVPGPKLGLV